LSSGNCTTLPVVAMILLTVAMEDLCRIQTSVGDLDVLVICNGSRQSDLHLFILISFLLAQEAVLSMIYLASTVTVGLCYIWFVKPKVSRILR
jgi:hypothetical protein